MKNGEPGEWRKGGKLIGKLALSQPPGPRATYFVGVCGKDVTKDIPTEWAFASVCLAKKTADLELMVSHWGIEGLITLVKGLKNQLPPEARSLRVRISEKDEGQQIVMKKLGFRAIKVLTDGMKLGEDAYLFTMEL